LNASDDGVEKVSQNELAVAEPKKTSIAGSIAGEQQQHRFVLKLDTIAPKIDDDAVALALVFVCLRLYKNKATLRPIIPDTAKTIIILPTDTNPVRFIDFR
jgi:hypothetical protein